MKIIIWEGNFELGITHILICIQPYIESPFIFQMTVLLFLIVKKPIKSGLVAFRKRLEEK